MLRRAFISGIALAVLAAPLTADAQRAGTMPRIGYLGTKRADNLSDAFKQGLSEHGYVDGQNIAIEWRFSEGRQGQVSGLAAELVQRKVDLIFAPTPEVAVPTRSITRTIPIVVAVGDPVANGLVESLARPGGNVTGLASISGELGAKRLELLKSAVSKLSKVAVLWVPSNPGHALALKNVNDAARSLKVEVQALEFRGASDLDKAFQAAQQWRADGLVVLDDSALFQERTHITELAGRSRLPAAWGFRQGAEAGGLIAYGANLRDQWRRAAGYVAKILKGAKPADLPVEEPTQYELVINLKTAKALGLTIPPSLLLRADQVIE